MSRCEPSLMLQIRRSWPSSHIGHANTALALYRKASEGPAHSRRPTESWHRILGLPSKGGGQLSGRMPIISGHRLAHGVRCMALTWLGKSLNRTFSDFVCDNSSLSGSCWLAESKRESSVGKPNRAVMPTPLVARRSSRAQTCSPNLAKCEMRCGALPSSALQCGAGLTPGPWLRRFRRHVDSGLDILASRCYPVNAKLTAQLSFPPLQDRHLTLLPRLRASKTNITCCLSVDPFSDASRLPMVRSCVRHLPPVSCPLDPTATLDPAEAGLASQHDGMTACQHCHSKMPKLE
ncbi:hypothetical protein L1887_43978 [Cichorium endivia]|nr:hypothetical protein L1887_43978 [Cichorium endivia]